MSVMKRTKHITALIREMDGIFDNLDVWVTAPQ